MKIENGRFIVYDNAITETQSKSIIRRQNWFKKKFNYDPNETYSLSVHENKYLGDVLGIKDILRDSQGSPITTNNSVVISTIRMGYGHYRIAMAGASCARAMGFSPLWLDLLAIPGISTDVINWCNTNYSKFSRISQQSRLF